MPQSGTASRWPPLAQPAPPWPNRPPPSAVDRSGTTLAARSARWSTPSVTSAGPLNPQPTTATGPPVTSRDGGRTCFDPGAARPSHPTREHVPDPTCASPTRPTAVPEQLALSPDGRSLVYVLRSQDVEADKPLSSLWRVPTDGGDAVRLTGNGRQLSGMAARRHPGGISARRRWTGPTVVAARRWRRAGKVSDLPGGVVRPVGSGRAAVALAAAVDLAAPDGEDDVARARRAQGPVVADLLDYQPTAAGYLRDLRNPPARARGQHRQVPAGDRRALARRRTGLVADGSRLGFSGWDRRRHRPAIAGGRLHRGRRRGRVAARARRLRDRLRPCGCWIRDGSALPVAGSVDAPTAPAGLFRLPWPVSEGSASDGLAADRSAWEGRPRRSTDRNVMAGRPGVPRRRSAIGRR